jgi:hypothetical protein
MISKSHASAHAVRSKILNRPAVLLTPLYLTRGRRRFLKSQRSRLLGLVRVLGTRVNVEFSVHLLAELALRQHA